MFFLSTLFNCSQFVVCTAKNTLTHLVMNFSKDKNEQCNEHWLVRNRWLAKKRTKTCMLVWGFILVAAAYCVERFGFEMKFQNSRWIWIGLDTFVKLLTVVLWKAVFISDGLVFNCKPLQLALFLGDSWLAAAFKFFSSDLGPHFSIARLVMNIFFGAVVVIGQQIAPIWRIRSVREQAELDRLKQEPVAVIDQLQDFLECSENTFMAFLHYLRSEFSSENLLFHAVVLEFRCTSVFQENIRTAIKTAQDIYDTYISSDSPLQLNLPFQVANKISNELMRCRASLDIEGSFEKKIWRKKNGEENATKPFQRPRGGSTASKAGCCGEATRHHERSFTTGKYKRS
mmetsp:Transcript_3791/g.7229  ORF Transcript_3791/g.7229 Transcript_3791/m.7229 type:complete len:343 (+) Transcript_3791:621-1649(+)